MLPQFKKKEEKRELIKTLVKQSKCRISTGSIIGSAEVDGMVKEADSPVVSGTPVNLSV